MSHANCSCVLHLKDTVFPNVLNKVKFSVVGDLRQFESLRPFWEQQV